MMDFNYFPSEPKEKDTMENPAIQAYGNRLFIDQTVSELLNEFLLVIFSVKEIGDTEFDTPLPCFENLLKWDKEQLEYAPKARLNLKLFALLGASSLESRHKSHGQHYEELSEELRERIKPEDLEGKREIVRTIEKVFLGLRGVGSGRGWTAQSFIPISPSLLARETIWTTKKAKTAENKKWREILGGDEQYFKMKQHAFYARGGELLYLQVCNALKQPHSQIMSWCQGGEELGLTKEEQNPEWLHSSLARALEGLAEACPSTLTELADFIDSSLDSDTPKETDISSGRYGAMTAGWCNAESWQEGYLFVVDILRIMQSNLDVVERVYLLEAACAMQALRTLARQSMRLVGSSARDYRLVVSSTKDKNPVTRDLSKQSLKGVEKMIFNALRSESIQLPDSEEDREKKLKEADKKYGHKMFLSLSKRLGFVIPKAGAGARFVLNDRLLRLLVVTTVPKGRAITFDRFKELLESHHQIVVDARGLGRTSIWLSGHETYYPPETDQWLYNMLEAAGFLTHLSDSSALIANPADRERSV